MSYLRQIYQHLYIYQYIVSNTLLKRQHQNEKKCDIATDVVSQGYKRQTFKVEIDKNWTGQSQGEATA